MKRFYLGLDLIRFFAAMAVTVYHLGFTNWLSLRPGYAAELAAIAPVASIGWVGVPIFFVLSGFVIAMSATDKTTTQFVQSRVLRLYPAAWICAGLSLVVLAVVGEPASFGTAVRSFTLSPVGPWVSGVYWTLGVEIVFYALVALVHAWLGNRAIPVLATGMTLVAAIYLGARLVDAATGGHFRETLVFFESTEASPFLLSSISYFAVGMSLWVILQRPTLWRAAVLCSSIILAFAVTTAAGLYNARLYPVEQWFAAPVTWAVCVGGIAASIWWRDRIENSLARWSLEIRTLGLMTYPLYLLHSVVGPHASLLVHDAWSSIAVGIAASIGASYVVVKLEPFARAPLARVIVRQSRHAREPLATTRRSATPANR